MKRQQIEVNSSAAIKLPTIESDMLNRIGHVTRSLHDSLAGKDLEDLDGVLGQVADGIPNTRDRLNYVSKMTEEAANKVLNATDAATPLQNEITLAAEKLEEKWTQSLEDSSLNDEMNAQAQETLDFLKMTVKNTAETKALMMEIVLAQDFQDLTGQVIKKITTLAEDLEKQLVQVLVDFSPEVKKEALPESETLMNGPQIDGKAENVVANQEQVDDLLDSLGF
jgi:chemotaxis protein CheZ